MLLIAWSVEAYVSFAQILNSSNFVRALMKAWLLGLWIAANLVF